MIGKLRKILIAAIACMCISAPQIAMGNDASTLDVDTITGFDPLDVSDYYFDGNPNEIDLAEGLPETLMVYLNNESETCEIPVSWEAVENLDETEFYFYSLKPVWETTYRLSPSLSEITDVPWITIHLQENTDRDTVFRSASAGDGQLSDISLRTAASGNTTAIYKYLKNTMGLNTAAACGIMTNLNAESGMSSTNLQNTYNLLFGLSDSEYTKRVNNGKGSYKTSSGKSKNFKTDSAGYGLCQWTSSGRKTNLLKFALNKDKSIGNRNMQLSFLKKELEESYPIVYATVTKASNKAAGAYATAAVFCLNFEIPANTVNTAKSRAKACLSGYWKSYSGKVNSGDSYLSLCGYSYPKTLRSGSGMTVSGYVVSNYKIKCVRGTILDSNGNTKYSKTVNPSSTAYSLYKLDNYMKFSKLSSGDYKYVLYAKDSHGSTVKKTHSFTVKSSGSSSCARGFAATK